MSLSDTAKKKVKTLSGGMKQRLGIAQTLLNNPKILVLDEPKDIITAINDKVFECLTDHKTAEKLMSIYPVINLRSEGKNTFLRLVCDKKPLEHAVNVPASLEDLYLYYFSEVNGNE